MNKIEILLDINPYGDLDHIQLSHFYKRFGFEWKDRESTNGAKSNGGMIMYLNWDIIKKFQSK